jgi:hypothetical protein
MSKFAKGMTYNLFFNPLFLLLLDPGSGLGENQDPASGIRDKHPGSATLGERTRIFF